MTKALYRKYRPTTLQSVKAQEAVVSPLLRSLKQGKISHAYLFTGPRGTGKTSIARILAHAINNFPYTPEDDYIDIIEIDAASNTGVDNIRELRETAIIAPTKGKYKVYIIDEVHMLSKSAFNALLKILEEPPKHVVFIMATTDPQKIPITITSRAQTYLFNLAPPEVMKTHLSAIAQKEKIKITPEALDIIVRRGGGSFRDSISLLDQISNLSSDQDITAEAVIEALGLPQDQQITTLLELYANADFPALTNQLKTILNTGSKPETIAEETLRQIINDPKSAYLPLLAKLPDVKAPFPEAKLLLAFLDFNTSPPSRSAAPSLLPRQSRPAPLPHSPANNSSAPASSAPSAPASAPPPESPSTPTPVAVGTSNPPTPPSTFEPNSFLETLKSRHAPLYAILRDSKFQKQGEILNIYTKNPNLVNSPNNKTLLSKLAGLAVNGLQLSEYKTADFSQISDIMGNVEEVIDDNGTPFN